MSTNLTNVPTSEKRCEMTEKRRGMVRNDKKVVRNDEERIGPQEKCVPTNLTNKCAMRNE